MTVAALVGSLVILPGCRLFSRAYACEDTASCGDGQVCVEGVCENGTPEPDDQEPEGRDGGEPDAEPAVEPDDGGEPGVEPGVEPDDGGEPGVEPGVEPGDGGEPDVGPGAEPDAGQPDVVVDAGEPEVDAGEPDVELDAGFCGGADLDTDPQNCGECGFDCGATVGCVNGRCGAQTAVGFSTGPGVVRSRGPNLFYAETRNGGQAFRIGGLDNGAFSSSNIRTSSSGKIYNMALTADSVALQVGPPNPPGPTNIEIAPFDGQVDNVVNIGDGNVSSSSNYGFALDGALVIGFGQNQIRRFARSTGNEINQNSIPFSFPRGTLFDATHVYWVADNNRVYKSEMATQFNAGDEFASLNSDLVIGASESPQYLFYALNQSPNELVRVEKESGAVFVLPVTITPTEFGSIHGTDNFLLYATSETNDIKIYQHSFATNQSALIFQEGNAGTRNIISMTLTGGYIYFVDAGPNGSDVRRVRLRPLP